MKKLSDDNMISQIRNGDDAVWSKFYAENYRMIENYIQKNSGTKEQAKDIYQDAMMILYKNINADNFELGSKLSTYLFSIVKNLWLKNLRDTKRHVVIEEKLSHIPPILLQDKVELEEKIVLVMSKIEEIGNPCSALLKAYYFLRKSMKEIALEFDYSSDKTAKAQKYKCVQRLKKLALNPKSL